MLKTILLLGFLYAYTRKLTYVVMETNYCSLFTKFVHWDWIRTLVKFQESLKTLGMKQKKNFRQIPDGKSCNTGSSIQLRPAYFPKKHPTLRFLTITFPSKRRKIISSRTSANGWSNIWNFDTNTWSFMRTWPSENISKFLIGSLREWDDPTEVWKCNVHFFNQ